ncbi:unnamed protein product [Mycena citricolor]|uniref:Uncharacterized protein n=1 Tax=Mycena citricolor TaxID=2018698 RepID=A0AAD2K6W1_9AGAR|nr:unnamed protein product [Mycena citricolor]CAK5282158.1 unnamed protein product [Mycena citricolor]
MTVLQEFTFEAESILEGAIRNAEDRARRYTLETSKSEHARQTTTVENRVATICANIDWRTRSFKIGQNESGVDVMKRAGSAFSRCAPGVVLLPAGGPLNESLCSVRYWRWLGGEEYQLKYSNSADAWTVSDANGTVLAELKSSISPIFGQTSLPLLRISPTVRSEEERLFFLLVLVYSETKRLDRQG